MNPQSQTVSQLKGILTDELGWTEYEAAAYCVLVINGEMEPQDIHLETNIPNSRVYGILSQLEDRGCVKLKDKRPKIYDAIHPREVIDEELKKFRRKSEAARSRLEQVWEAERSQSKRHDSVWAFSSISSTVNHVCEQYEQADESILVVDDNLQWMSRKNHRRLGERSEEGIKVSVIGRTGSDKLARLADEGVETKEHEEVQQSYYIFDEERVILRVGRGKQGLSFKDTTIANILLEDYNQLNKEATEVTTFAP